MSRIVDETREEAQELYKLGLISQKDYEEVVAVLASSK